MHTGRYAHEVSLWAIVAWLLLLVMSKFAGARAAAVMVVVAVSVGAAAVAVSAVMWCVDVCL